jgi:L-asparaginase II
MGLPDGRGLALKVRDGAGRAVAPAAVALARAVLGLAAEVAPGLAAAPIRNSRGVLVGELVAEGTG